MTQRARKLNSRKKTKKRPGEIRGLRAGMYSSEDDDMLLDIFRDDDGVHVVHVDFELEMVSHWIIDERGRVAQFLEGLQSPCDEEDEDGEGYEGYEDDYEEQD